MEYIFTFNYLVLIYNAKQNFLIDLAVNALAVKPCGTVVELFENFLLDRLRVRCDDNKFVSGFKALEYVIADKACDKAIKNAKANGLVIKYPLTVNTYLAVNE